jgi:predicted RNase H-like HicB family nuclease
LRSGRKSRPLCTHIKTTSANLPISFPIPTPSPFPLFAFSPPGLLWYDDIKEPAMFINFTAKYTKISSGYLGQLIEWPEVLTEGRDLENCRALLRDALNEMILAYRQQGQEIPLDN